MTGPTPAPVAALLLLSAALLVAGGRPARERLCELAAAAPAAESRPAPPLRPAWVVVGALAVGALAFGIFGWGVTGAAAAVLATGAAGVLAGLVSRSAAALTDRTGTGGEALAGSWELLAVCLRAGLPVATAVSAATGALTGPIGDRLRRVAGLLALGADPATAWAGSSEVPALVVFARAAGRSAGTGAALAHVAAAEAERLRSDLLDSAKARAQRAAVLIAGPLGLCFLPAFLVLGIAPVVIGLAREALAPW